MDRFKDEPWQTARLKRPAALQAIMKMFFRRNALLVLVIVFFLIPFAGRGARMALEQMKNDVKDWLPSDFRETEELDWFREHFMGEQFVVVSWEGCTEESQEYQALLGKLTETPLTPSERKAQAEAEEAGATPTEVTAEVEFIGDQLGLYVEYVPDEDDPDKLVREFHENWGLRKERWLRGAGDLRYFITPKGDLYKWGGGNSLPQAAFRGITRAIQGPMEVEGKRIASFGPLDGPYYYNDPTQLEARLFKSVTSGPLVLEQLTQDGGPLEGDSEEAHRRLEGTLYGSDGTQTCLIVTLTAAAKRDLKRVLSRGLMAQSPGKLVTLADESDIRLAELRLGGPPVDNVAIDEEGQITLARLIGFCAALGLGLAYLCFRSVKATLMVFVVGGVSALASLGFVYWTGSRLDAILMSMPAVVYVLGLSGAVHVVNYYRDAVREDGLIGAPEKAVSHGFWPCTIAAITTAIGLLSLATSNIVPIKKFGIFSAMGVLATIVLLFTYLPAALETWPLPRRKEGSDNQPRKRTLGDRFAAFWEGVGQGIIRHNIPVAIICLIVSCFFAFGVMQINTSVNLLKMFDGSSKIIGDYTWLENNIGKLVPMEIVVRVRQDGMRSTTPSIPADEQETEGDKPQYDKRLQYTFLERMEMADRVQRVIEKHFGPDANDVVGHTTSAATFAPLLPSPRASFTTRSAMNRGLGAQRHQFIDADYLNVDKESNDELWRVSLRLGALDEPLVDYGTFVNDLKHTVEPLIEAYRIRDEVLRQIDEKQQGKGLNKAGVYLLGAALPTQETKQKASENTSGEKQDAVVEFEDDAALVTFGTTLKDLLGTHVKKVIAHDPKRKPLPPMTKFTRQEELAGLLKEAKALAKDDPQRSKLAKEIASLQQQAAYPKTFANADCVVILSDDPTYDLEFIREHCPLVIDLRDAWQAEQLVADYDQNHTDKEPAVVSTVYTGVVPLVYKAQRTLLESLIQSIGWAFVLIALVMAVILRSPTAGLMSMLPNVFPVVLIFGAMGWMGIAVDIGTMMTASVAMGVAVDDTIHFLTWFRKGLDQGLDRREAIMLSYKRVAMAMAQTTAIGGLGLAVFMASTFTPTQRFGTLMLTLLMAALIGDLIFLPAILAGPVGRVFGKRRKPKSQKEKVEGAQGESSETTANEENGSKSDTTATTPHSQSAQAVRDPQRIRQDTPHNRRGR